MPRCIRCRKVGEVEGWGRRRNGWLRLTCPACDAARTTRLRCRRCGVSVAERPDWGRYERDGSLKPFCPDCYASGRVKPANGKHACKQCGALAISRPDWGRYENNARLKSLCPECDQRAQARRKQAQQRNAVAAASGYGRGWTSTPEYHRIQRERDAAREGRGIDPYMPQDERNRRGLMVDAEQHADSIRSRWIREWLRPFRQSAREFYGELYRTDPLYREQQKALYREHYRRHRDDEVDRVAAYKRMHANRNLEWTATRKAREAMLADGTVTPEAVTQLKREAIHCAYCNTELTSKQTDHMNPVVLGGEHSLRNIAIVCPSCNGMKAKLSYEEWLERVDPQHRERVLALYRERHGQSRSASAIVLPL